MQESEERPLKPSLHYLQKASLTPPTHHSTLNPHDLFLLARIRGGGHRLGSPLQRIKKILSALFHYQKPISTPQHRGPPSPSRAPAPQAAPPCKQRSSQRLSRACVQLKDSVSPALAPTSTDLPSVVVRNLRPTDIRPFSSPLSEFSQALPAGHFLFT